MSTSLERNQDRRKVEEILGKKLPPKAEIHHFGKSGDPESFLIVCEDRTYHAMLHIRQEAFAVCGHAHWRKCIYIASNTISQKSWLLVLETLISVILIVELPITGIGIKTMKKGG